MTRHPVGFTPPDLDPPPAGDYFVGIGSATPTVELAAADGPPATRRWLVWVLVAVIVVALYIAATVAAILIAADVGDRVYRLELEQPDPTPAQEWTA